MVLEKSEGVNHGLNQRSSVCIVRPRRSVVPRAGFRVVRVIMKTG